MPANQKPLNQIEIFWYHFTPRKLLYHIVSLNLVKFGPHWLFCFFCQPCIMRTVSLERYLYYTMIPLLSKMVLNLFCDKTLHVFMPNFFFFFFFGGGGNLSKGKKKKSPTANTLFFFSFVHSFHFSFIYLCAGVQQSAPA